MSKAVLISIQPQWCELIASGKKTVEVRKNAPKLGAPFKCYIYCTKTKNPISLCTHDSHDYTCGKTFRYSGGGEVIGEFVCKEIESFTTDYRADKVQTERISRQSCVDMVSLAEYEYNAPCLFGWHISDLVIYDKRKDLGEFKPWGRECHYNDLGLAIPKCENCRDCKLTRPPQSWCYVEGR